MPGWIGEVEVDGKFSRNSVVWPDEHSALCSAKDLFGRWILCTNYRASEVNEEPNRPTWDEHVAKNGLPARSVQL